MVEGNLSSGNMLQGNSSYGGFNLQGPVPVHHHQQQHNSHPRQGSSMVLPTSHENFSLTIGNTQEQTISFTDYIKEERVKPASDEDDPSFMEDPSGGKRASQWQRVKWTDTMVRLLITAVSYISEEAVAEYGCGGRRKYANLHKKGKWKSVSKVMAERGHFVSPQQCEDKFNDLNKRYKRLNEILGRGTSCEVVENPTLLDMMDHISEKAKEEVQKILSSKHLHYEEMCSYHNGNRLHLPPDPDLQRSLRLALRSGDDHDENDVNRHLQDDNVEVDQEAESDSNDEYEENHGFRGDLRVQGIPGNSTKRLKQCQGAHEEFSFRSSLNSLVYKKFNFQPEIPDADVTQAPPEGMKANMSQRQLLNHRTLQLEEQRLHIEAQMLELEKERFKWQRFCQKKDRELEMTKMEIERMKLENEQMCLDLRRREMGIDRS